MSFKAFVHEYKLKNEATSDMKIYRIVQTIPPMILPYITETVHSQQLCEKSFTSFRRDNIVCVHWPISF